MNDWSAEEKAKWKVQKLRDEFRAYRRAGNPSEVNYTHGFWAKAAKKWNISMAEVYAAVVYGRPFGYDWLPEDEFQLTFNCSKDTI